MRCVVAVLLACLLGLALSESETHEKHTRKHHHGHHHGKHHHGKHHHKHHHHSKEAEKPAHEVKTAEKAKEPKTAAAAAAKAKLEKAAPKVAKAAPVKEDAIVMKMKALESKLAKRKAVKQGEILVNGPLPKDFKERFAQAVADATKTSKQEVKVTSTKASGTDGVMKVSFMASPKVVESVETEAADPDSKLANGNLHTFLVSKGDDDEEPKKEAKGGEEPKEEPKQPETHAVAPVEEKGIDIDTAMPYGDLEPFGREDTAQELTEDSISESNSMVDQLERAEVAEEKRAVFRALTRLRGAAITSFDGVARSQTGNIDEYNKIHQWRKTHPLHHLADEESDVSKWAFPDNADF